VSSCGAFRLCKLGHNDRNAADTAVERMLLDLSFRPIAIVQLKAMNDSNAAMD